MKKEFNPFPVQGYFGPEFFCDRENESKRLISNIINGVNTSLISARRMGKSGLLHHVFQQLAKDSETKCVYIDLFHTQNQQEFTNILATSLLQTYPDTSKWGRSILQFLKQLRPVFSFDPGSGLPEVSLTDGNSRQGESTLLSIFRFLESQNFTIVVALDEFQQITQYPETNTEAFLRTHIQNMKNIRFIFSGSSKTLLHEMFNSAKRPFFASTHTMHLGTIQNAQYKPFILHHFNSSNRQIEESAIDWILDFAQSHTWYVQAQCNRLFADKQKMINLEIARKSAYSLVAEQENTYFQYRSMLTLNQWKLLTAIGKVEKVWQINSKDFFKKSQLYTSSQIARSLSSLLDMNLVQEENDEQGRFYHLSDPFLCRWLQWRG